MNMLTTAGFEKAIDFIRRDARPLERALFAYWFEQGTREAVLAALAAFQNADGGFGRGLESDVRCPDSSALATGIALSTLREVGCLPDDPLVGSAVAYLLKTVDRATGRWRVVPPAANEHPHAPWWHDEAGSLARTFDDFVVIPRAQLLGLLSWAHELVPEEWLESMLAAAAQEIVDADDAVLGGGGDALVYAQVLAQAPTLAPAWRERLRDRLQAAAATLVCRDPAEWGTYCATPLKVAAMPDAPLAETLADILPVQLDVVIEQQNPAGYWEPTWSWGDWYPEAWQTARQEWRGELTLRTLRSLQAYGRVAPVSG